MARRYHPALSGLTLGVLALVMLAAIVAGRPVDRPPTVRLDPPAAAPPAPVPPTAPPPAASDPRPGAVVALGDSLPAGEGAGAYLPDPRAGAATSCHRSERAFVQRVSLPRVTQHINLACSGADTTDVAFGDDRATQAARLGAVAERVRVRAVLLTVGANDDPRFAQSLLRCIQAWARPARPPCSAALDDQWSERLDDMIPKVVDVVGDVRAAMRGAGYTEGQYTLTLTSYPSPLTEQIVPALQDLSGCPLRTPDLRWIRTEAVPELSAALQQAARSAGVRFLDLSRASAGHEACASLREPGREWINRLTVDFGVLREPGSGLRAVVESFHPNTTGHAKLAGCVTEFLRTRARRAGCLVGPDEQLHALRAPGRSR